MVWSRTAAINYLKDATLCNGLVLEYRGMVAEEGKQRVFLMNQCGLVATVFKKVGDPTWMLIRDTIAQYRAAYGYTGASNLRNYFYPIIDQAVIPITPAFEVAEERHLFDTTVTDDDHPSEIILHWEPAMNLSETCGDIRMNRAFMRALYHYQQGQTSTANTCYDNLLATRRPEGWHLADNFVDPSEGGTWGGFWKYRVYKQMLQWIVAKGMGRSRLYTDVLDVMQDPIHGGVRTFYKTNYSFIDRFHNTETTALAVLADLLWNPP